MANRDRNIVRRARQLPPAEKIWEHLDVRDDRFDKVLSSYEPTVRLGTSLQVWSRPGKVTLSSRSKLAGHRWKNAKRKLWVGWRRDRSVSVHFGPSGVLLYGIDYRGMCSGGDGTHSRTNGVLGLIAILRARPDHRAAFLTEFTRQTGQRLVIDTHPALVWNEPAIADAFALDASADQVAAGIDALGDIPSVGYLSAAQTADMRAHTARLFGAKSVRKDLVKAVARADAREVMLVSSFRGLTPVDHLVHALKSLENCGRRWDENVSTVELRSLLKELDPRSFPRLLRDDIGYAVQTQYLRDTLRQFRIVRELGEGSPFAGAYVRSWSELHDLPLTHRQRMNEARMRQLRKKEADVVIKHDELAEQLHESTVSPYRLVCASTGGQLHEWGDEMHNCIGSYVSDAQRGNCLLGGVYEGQKLIANFEIQRVWGFDVADGAQANRQTIIANFEIQRGRLQQLYGRYNRPLSPEAQQILGEHFDRLGVDAGGFRGRTHAAAA